MSQRFFFSFFFPPSNPKTLIAFFIICAVAVRYLFHFTGKRHKGFHQWKEKHKSLSYGPYSIISVIKFSWNERCICTWCALLFSLSLSLCFRAFLVKLVSYGFLPLQSAPHSFLQGILWPSLSGRLCISLSGLERQEKDWALLTPTCTKSTGSASSFSHFNEKVTFPTCQYFVITL